MSRAPVTRPGRASRARRKRLDKQRVLHAAVVVADRAGIDALSMRRLAGDLGVAPMALYKHVADKEELLDGMLDVVLGEIDLPAPGSDWKSAVRKRILSARQALLRHPWASRVIETRTRPTPVALAYIDAMIGILRNGGFSPDLTHHALHALGSRLYGFTQDVFDDSGKGAGAQPSTTARDVAATYPHIAEMMTVIYHDAASVVGPGCDDQFEFELALDLLLDGLDKRRRRDSQSVRPEPALQRVSQRPGLRAGQPPGSVLNKVGN